jgi:hypothetical protein
LHGKLELRQVATIRGSPKEAKMEDDDKVVSASVLVALLDLEGVAGYVTKMIKFRGVVSKLFPPGAVPVYVRIHPYRN